MGMVLSRAEDTGLGIRWATLQSVIDELYDNCLSPDVYLTLLLSYLAQQGLVKKHDQEMYYSVHTRMGD